jgi:hypothetical protein
MDASSTMMDNVGTFRSPPRILIPKLILSRDKWKAKATRRKHELKKTQINARDLSASRDRWKKRALAAEQQTQDLQSQLQQAQSQLAQSRAEVAHLGEELSKKRLI